MEKEIKENKEIKNNNKFEAEVKEASDKIVELKNEVHKKIVWQDFLIESLVIAILSEGHVLLEWVPWLAKTLTVDTLSKALELWFNRIQFTPDLLPSDLIWTEIYNQKTWEFDIKKGPIFNNFILADEINRAPSKVQSALLEAMAEGHITIAKNTFELEKPFIVLATQNPVEQVWTYKLPEAWLDRFMLKVDVDYPTKQEEREVYKKITSDEKVKINKIFTKKDIFKLQKLVKDIYVSENIYDYVSDIIDASRNPKDYDLSWIEKYIDFWISPRWWISLINAAKANALIENRTFIIPEDIKKMAKMALAHRLVLSYEAVAMDITSSQIIDNILQNVKVK